MARDRNYGYKIAKGLAKVAGAASRLAPFVIAVYAVFALVALFITLTRLEINTDTNAMISQDLPFRQDFKRLNEAFPALENNFIVVVEADDPNLAREAAKSLVISFAGHPDLFKHIYSPGISEFFDDHGLLYVPQWQFQSIMDRLGGSAPFLQALAREPTLPGLTGLMANIARSDNAELPEQIAFFFDGLSNVFASYASGRSRTMNWQSVLAAQGDLKGVAPSGSDDGGRHFIFVQPALDFTALEPAEAALSAARRLASDREVTRSGKVQISFTGEAVMTSEELRTVADGAWLAGIISLVLVSCILAFGVRSWRLVFATLSMLIVGLMLTAGFAAMTIGYLNLVSVAFAVLFVGLGIDFAIHFALRFEEEQTKIGHAAETLRHVASSTGPALLLCTATTTLAFLSFVPTDFAGMSQLGIISAGGIIIAFILSMTLLPALLAILPGDLRTARGRLFSWHLRPPSYGLRKYLTWGILILGVAALYVIPSATFNGDPIDLKDPSSPAVKAFKALSGDQNAPSYTGELLVDDEKQARHFTDLLQDLRIVREVISALSFVPPNQDGRIVKMQNVANILPGTISTQIPNRGDQARAGALTALVVALRAIEQNKKANAKLRGSAQKLRRTVEVYTNTRPGDVRGNQQLELAIFSQFPAALSDIRRKLSARQISVDTLAEGLQSRYLSSEGKYRLNIIPAEAITDEATMRRFVKAVREIAPHTTGAPVEIVEAADAVVRAMLQATGSAALMIAIILFITLRRIGDVLLVLLPIVLAGVLLLASTVMVSVPFNFANVIVLPLLIGLGVDSGIHLVMRTREEIAASHQAQLLDTSTPRAVLLSALTTIASFGSLAVSSHRGIASMGELLTLAIVFTLLCTLIVLPTLVDWFLKPRRRRPLGR